MFYDIGFTGRVSIAGDSKKDAVKKIQMIIENSLNFDPSSFCSAFVISRKDDETDGDQT